MSASENTFSIRGLFSEEAEKHKLRGILGVTAYNPVYDALMPVQKQRLEEFSGARHQGLMDSGFIISIAYVYPDGVIDNIGVSSDGVYDKETWNIYTDWYTTLNRCLNETSKTIADAINGIPLPATSEGMARKIKSTTEYYPTVVSHRVHAQHSGIGWRGENSLIVNPVYSCMIRLAGVITDQPLIATQKQTDFCKDCTSCLQVCTFLRHMDKLDNYRDQCLAYMNWLELDDEVCGRCIKACVHSRKFS